MRKPQIKVEKTSKIRRATTTL